MRASLTRKLEILIEVDKPIPAGKSIAVVIFKDDNVFNSWTVESNSVEVID